MKATVGDRLVIAETSGGQRFRIGIITGVYHSDGSPPYVVRWLNEDNGTVVFPGPDAHVEHYPCAFETAMTGM